MSIPSSLYHYRTWTGNTLVWEAKISLHNLEWFCEVWTHTMYSCHTNKVPVWSSINTIPVPWVLGWPIGEPFMMFTSQYHIPVRYNNVYHTIAKLRIIYKQRRLHHSKHVLCLGTPLSSKNLIILLDISIDNLRATNLLNSTWAFLRHDGNSLYRRLWEKNDYQLFWA